ncbi:uncharacterized protein [Paramormyrops kingsleyae]
MRAGRTWLLWLAAAATLYLLEYTHDTEAMVHARVAGAADLACNSGVPSLTSDASSGRSPPPVDPTPLHVVEWLRQGYNVPILIKFGVHAPRVHPDYEGRATLTHLNSLRVDHLRLQDEGWYECRILQLDRLAEDSRNGSWIFLSVAAPPVFIKTPPPSLEVLQGDWLSLACSGHGNPTPAVTWRKSHTAADGSATQDAPLNVSNGTLSFGAVSRAMAGEYTCILANNEGQLSHSTHLRVKGPPVIITPPEDTALNMSQDALLQCQAEADPPNMTYVWLKQDVNVYHVDSLKSRVKILVDGTLLIHNLLPEDAGNYTCMPTNGLLTAPTASAYLTVKHPAQTLWMPRETYLPTGIGGRIPCPVRAEPPLLYVIWTKDGEPLDLELFPGWTLDSEGAVLIAAANDNALGVYACTPYNSYGTMGQSDPTTTVLQDPPTFSVSPQEEYRQEVGRELVIPCQADGDQYVNITWRKVGSSPRSPYIVATNGSLVLRPLSKDHQGVWECSAANRVAAVTTVTEVFVLGTSPHAVSSVSVVPGTDRANVSWEPGFDGGFVQKFTVWLKQGSTGRQEWTSLPASSFTSSLLVLGLLSGTSYQFSVLPQNQMGTGPFSEIITVRTLVPIADPPLVRAKIPNLAPPTSLVANRSSSGLVLQWSPPIPQYPPISGFVLQARHDEGDWLVLERDISPNASELLVQGLLKDCNYELRMFSRQDELVGEPSVSVNISTRGMEAYPAEHEVRDLVPEPLLAGVAGGVVFLCVAILFSLGMACAVRTRRKRRRRKRREDLQIALHKSQLAESSLSRQSPDSILKMKMSPGTISHPGSSPSQSHCFSFDKITCEFQDHKQDQRLLSSPPPRYTFPQSPPIGLCSSATLESISRGPDGRFVLHPLENSPPDTPEDKQDLRADFTQSSDAGSSHASQLDSLKSDSPRSEKEQRKKTSPIFTVDLPVPVGRVRGLARNFSEHARLYQDHKQGLTEGLLEQSHSEGKEDRVRDYVEHLREVIPDLSRLEKDPVYLPLERDGRLTATSTLVMQMEHERERGNLAKCLKLAREREELERELEQYTSSLRVRAWQSDSPDQQPIWKRRNATLPRKSKPAFHLGSTCNTLGKKVSSAYLLQDVTPLTSFTSLVPVQSSMEKARPFKQLLRTQPQGDDTDWEGLSQSSFSKRTSPSHRLPICDTAVLLPEYFSSRQRCPNENYSYGWKEEAEHCDDSANTGTQPAELGPIYSSQQSNFKPKSTTDRFNMDKESDSGPLWNQLSPYPEPSPPKSILEYLNLPGFVEMSVDEPVAESDTATSKNCCPSLDQECWTSLQGEPDVVPKDWSTYTQDSPIRDTDQIGDILPSGNSQISKIQGSELPSRICISPVSFLKESVILDQFGPEKCSSKKSASQEFLDPNAWIDSLNQSQACASPFSSRSVTDLHRQPECSTSTDQQSSNHSQQATLFSDASKWPTSYQEALTSVHHKLTPLRSSVSLGSSRLSTEMGRLRPRDAAVKPTKAFRPTGYSLPSRGQVFFHQRDSESEGEEVREQGMELEIEIGGRKEDKEERDSFASQSSGRGSLGPTGTQPVSPTPTQPGCVGIPGQGKGLMEQLGMQPKSRGRRTSGDESYEWDSTDSCPESIITKTTGLSYMKDSMADGQEPKMTTRPHAAMDSQSKCESLSSYPVTQYTVLCNALFIFLSVSSRAGTHGPEEHAYTQPDYHTLRRVTRRQNSFPVQNEPSTASF